MPQETSIMGVTDEDGFEATTSVSSSRYRPSAESYTASSEAHNTRHIDLVSAHLQENILIKKPYASMLPIPKWPHCEAESPFLLCFPRGTADYRLYGIFPREGPIDLSWLGEQPPRIPLVMPQPIKGIGERVHFNALYGVTVVFKQRRSRPGRFVAICLTNAVAVDRGSLMPSCKIVRDWSPSRNQDVDSMDLTGFGDIDTAGETLVTGQKVTCDLRATSEGYEPRFIGVTQVVFDRLKLREELYSRSEEASKASRGILDSYGEEVSEED